MGELAEAPMNLGPQFSIKADRKACLQSAGIALVCLALLTLLLWSFQAADNWFRQLEFAISMILPLLGSVIFGFLAYLRWLDWTRAVKNHTSSSL